MALDENKIENDLSGYRYIPISSTLGSGALGASSRVSATETVNSATGGVENVSRSIIEETPSPIQVLIIH